jgi:hypothetical protein
MRDGGVMSAFVWLDYPERERRKMVDVVDLFRETWAAYSRARSSDYCRNIVRPWSRQAPKYRSLWSCFGLIVLEFGHIRYSASQRAHCHSLQQSLAFCSADAGLV